MYNQISGGLNNNTNNISGGNTGFTVSPVMQQIMALAQKSAMQPNPISGQAPTSGAQSSAPNGLMPDSTINNISALSQMFGYKPNTTFGYNLGGSGQGSMPNQNDMMSMTGIGPTQQQTGQGPAPAQAQNQNQNDFWSKLWSIFGGSQNGNTSGQQ